MLGKKIYKCYILFSEKSPKKLLHTLNSRTKKIDNKSHWSEGDEATSFLKNLTSVNKEKLSKLIDQKILNGALCLIDSTVAKKISESIFPYVAKNSNKVLSECTPCLGLLTKQLLKIENGPIKLFEPSKVFRAHLKDMLSKKDLIKSIQLYPTNLFNTSRTRFLCQHSYSKYVETLFKTVQKKAWTDDPVLSIIGPIQNNMFFEHIIDTIPTQTSISSFGLVEIFAIMKPSHYLGLTTKSDLCISNYYNRSVLFNLYFDHKILYKLPRKAYIPWERKSKKKRKELHSIDSDKLYLVHIIVKKDLPLPLEQLIPFNFFVRQFLRKTRIIPKIEDLVEDSGAHVLIPQLQHEDYFENLNIFTEFKELTPTQVLGVFREVYHHPKYEDSAFSKLLEINSQNTDFNSEPEDSFFDEEQDWIKHFEEDDEYDC